MEFLTHRRKAPRVVKVVRPSRGSRWKRSRRPNKVGALTRRYRPEGEATGVPEARPDRALLGEENAPQRFATRPAEAILGVVKRRILRRALGSNPYRRFGNRRGAGARSRVLRSRISVGRILSRDDERAARRAPRSRPSQTEAAASLTRATVGRRRIGAQSSRIVQSDERARQFENTSRRESNRGFEVQTRFQAL